MRESLEAITQQCILPAWIIHEIEEIERVKREKENRRPQPTIEVPVPTRPSYPCTEPNPITEDDPNRGVVIIESGYSLYR